MFLATVDPEPHKELIAWFNNMIFHSRTNQTHVENNQINEESDAIAAFNLGVGCASTSSVSFVSESSINT